MSGYIGLIANNINSKSEELINNCHSEIVSVCDDYSGKFKGTTIDLRFGLFKANDDTDSECLPYTMDQNLYVVGDVRLDDREGLLLKINKKFPALTISTPDSYILLHCYLIWGKDCVKHISGDYSFAIWNEKDKTLFCARDHFGIIPFYYASIEIGFIFTNFYYALKQVNGLTKELNEAVLKNYFCLGNDESHTATIYKKIHKLAPAHTLIFENGNYIIEKYWSPQIPSKLIRYKTDEEYITRFNDIFERSIADRIRNKKIVAQLSGGMDSSSITAFAQKVLSKKYPEGSKLIAHNLKYNYLVNEREGYFANLIAEHLKIEIKQFIADDYLKKISLTLTEWIPEPVGIPESIPEKAMIREVVNSNSKLMLTGFGSDALFAYNTQSWVKMIQKIKIFNLLVDVFKFIKNHAKLPPFGIISILKKIFKTNFDKRSSLPIWIKGTYISENDVKAAIGSISLNAGMFSTGLWQSIFEQSHQGFSRNKVKVRHPFYSLELIEFIQALPAHLVFNKYLLRLSLTPYLPAIIVNRPKTLLHGGVHLNNLLTSGVLKELYIEIKKEEDFLKNKIDIECLISLIENPTNIKREDYQTIIYLINILAWKKFEEVELEY